MRNIMAQYESDYERLKNLIDIKKKFIKECNEKLKLGLDEMEDLE